MHDLEPRYWVERSFMDLDFAITNDVFCHPQKFIRVMSLICCFLSILYQLLRVAYCQFPFTQLIVNE